MQLLRFIGSGLTASAGYAITGVLLEEAGLPSAAGNAIAFVVACAISYGLQRSWTFQSCGPHRQQAGRFLLVQLVNLAVAAVAHHVMQAHLPHWGRYALVAALLSCCNYLLFRSWVFRPNRLLRN